MTDHDCAFPIVTATTRVDGFDHDQQLGRALDCWLNDLVVSGALAPEDKARIRWSLSYPELHSAEGRVSPVEQDRTSGPRDEASPRGVGTDAVYVTVPDLGDVEMRAGRAPDTTPRSWAHLNHRKGMHGDDLPRMSGGADDE